MVPALYALTSLYAPAERRGGMMAIASSLTILGNMLGPVLGGMVAGQWGIMATFIVNSLLLLATGGILWKYFEPDAPVRQSLEGLPAGSPAAPVPHPRQTDSHQVLS